MRKFKLYNNKGQMIDLNDGIAFLNNPSGLGFEYKNSYTRADNQFIETSELLEQKSIEGSLVFKTYADYKDFVKFIQAKPLILEYAPTNESYRISCKVSKLSKGELGEGGILSCDVTFDGLGQWYKYIYLETDPDAKGKTYTYKYPFKYTSSSSNSVRFESESALSSPVTITFIGAVKNPSWSHYINGELVAEGKVNADIESGHRLKITSVMPYSIIETDSAGNEIVDRYGDSDFSTERFLNIGLGTNVITCRSDSSKTYAIVEGFEYYESI